MARKEEEQELTPDAALERAQQAIADPVLAQLGITIGAADDAGLRIAKSLADAGSLDDLLQEGGTNGWEDQAGRSFLIRGAEYAPSTKPGGLGFFAIVTVRDAETGEQLILTTGAQNVVIQVAKIVKEGWTDVPVELYTTQSAAGNTVHRLKKGEAGAVPY